MNNQEVSLDGPILMITTRQKPINIKIIPIVFFIALSLIISKSVYKIVITSEGIKETMVSNNEKMSKTIPVFR